MYISVKATELLDACTQVIVVSTAVTGILEILKANTEHGVAVLRAPVMKTLIQTPSEIVIGTYHCAVCTAVCRSRDYRVAVINLVVFLVFIF